MPRINPEWFTSPVLSAQKVVLLQLFGHLCQLPSQTIPKIHYYYKTGKRTGPSCHLPGVIQSRMSYVKSSRTNRYVATNHCDLMLYGVRLSRFAFPEANLAVTAKTGEKEYAVPNVCTPYVLCTEYYVRCMLFFRLNSSRNFLVQSSVGTTS